MPKYFIYEGEPVYFEYSSGKKYARFIEENNHLVAHECSKAEYDEAQKVKIKQKVRSKRAAEYDNGDAVDAILKQFNVMRMAGQDMCEDLDAALAHWLKVKADNPMPE